MCQPVAALMANGLKTGLVVDVGEYMIDVAPVYEGTQAFSVRLVLVHHINGGTTNIWWLI
jgi:actin-related protein